ncbi:NAD(P)-binding protein [uncultured Roseibium sp.]|uniref:NAD(P)-binding protein n=1 Tax=uncultured Roseibium sp. TaxID=1936171 RepID=UPI0026352238|nr:NAD(P)-binding protein [uncultured Roseibium sp.]
MIKNRVAIVGGGPGGLALARTLAGQDIDFTLFEAGPALSNRRHNRAEDLGTGIGGAGLFSDGKFSFFPSGTHLYRLDRKDRLENAFTDIETLLREVGIPIPTREFLSPLNGGAVSDCMHSKVYPSSYGSLEQREILTARMIQGFEYKIRTETRVSKIEMCQAGYRISFETPSARQQQENFNAVVLATGRFGPSEFPGLMGNQISTTEQRYEFGIRIEHKNGVGFLSRVKRPDVKLILNTAGCEVRTFCTCRDGEVWRIPYGKAAALSGRSDGPPSGYSNFGLLARFTDDRLERGRDIWATLQSSIDQDTPALWQPLSEFLKQVTASKLNDQTNGSRPWFPKEKFMRGDIANQLPPELYRILCEGIRVLVDQFPDIASDDTICLFPAVEGVGHFPASDATLESKRGNIWFCGDIVGRFRGLVPALVSGAYVGRAIGTRFGRAIERLPEFEQQSVPAE